MLKGLSELRVTGRRDQKADNGGTNAIDAVLLGMGPVLGMWTTAS